MDLSSSVVDRGVMRRLPVGGVSRKRGFGCGWFSGWRRGSILNAAISNEVVWLRERSLRGSPTGFRSGQLLINVVKLLRVHGGCLGVERR